jgi:pimeloyl-ACP methyl ester carboxylesterase
MSTYVLIPGAWLGGWAWQRVSRDLRDKGHTVYPVSLTGLAERVHLGGPDVNLDTHITDVVNLLKWEDLHDVILVGHSYAGFFVAGVADRAPERVGTVVYCDSGPLPNGLSILATQSPEGQTALENQVKDGWRWPFPGFSALGEGASLKGLADADKQLMTDRAVDHPFNTWTQPLQMSSTPADFNSVVIVCEDGHRFLPMVKPMLPDARYLELDTGHWPMLSTPKALAGLLDGIR